MNIQVQKLENILHERNFTLILKASRGNEKKDPGHTTV